MSKPKKAAASSAPENLAEGRVTASHGRHFAVTTAAGEVLEAHRRGKRSDVVIGDMVRCSPPASGVAAIEEVLPRTSLLMRSDGRREKPLAANADQVCVVFASRPTFNARFLWRAVIAAGAAGLGVLLVRNKIDLAQGAEQAEKAAAFLEALGVPALRISAEKEPQAAREALIGRLAGHRTLLVGQSGMGKSTILNLLISRARAKTQAFSEALDLGRQTTTSSNWYDAGDDGWQGAVIDSPGFQDFGLAHMSEGAVLRAMPDIARCVDDCRFFNCRHLQEPGCSVKKAVEEGRIDAERYDFYRSLIEELDAASQRH